MPGLETTILNAIERLVSGMPLRALSTDLTDRNLILEAGTSKASLYRCTRALEQWHQIKQKAVSDALEQFEARVSDGSADQPQEAELLAAARIDRAALRRMPPDIQQRWQRIQRFVGNRKAEATKDELIASLVAKLYATTLAVRKRDAIIAQQAALIEKLGGNVRKLRA